jgi:hypothetical protein
MLDTKERIETAITRARTELEDALVDLQGLPLMDQTSFSFGIHALTNMLTFATASVDIIQSVVKPSPKSRAWRSIWWSSNMRST